MHMKKNNSDLASALPFDQYSRQLVVSTLINDVFKKDKMLEIIDLGGHKGKTHEFHPDDKITIIDLFDEEYPGYVRGDATNTKFADKQFDVAVSFDVFEHIPRSRRLPFIKEGLRISKQGMFIAMPVDDKLHTVSSAEVRLNRYHQSIFKEDHQWLKEHIDYRIPTEEEITELVKKAGAYQISLSSNQIGDWQLLQMLIFSSASNPDITTDVEAINNWYNENILDLDSSVDVGYRRIFFVTKDIQAYESVKKIIEKKSKTPPPSMTIHSRTFDKFSETLANISRKYNDLYKAYGSLSDKQRKIVELEKHIEELYAHNKKLTREIDTIYRSVSWKATRPFRAINKLKKLSQKSDK